MQNKMNQEEVDYISFEDFNTKGLKGAKNGQSYRAEIHGEFMHITKVFIQRKKIVL